MSMSLHIRHSIGISVGAAMLMTAACGGSAPTTPGADGAAGAGGVVASGAHLGQVSLCHAEGNGSYHMISVAPEAEPAHRAHGDGKVGDPVPGRAPMVFGEDCRLLGPAVDMKKFTNGADADSAPGPSIVVGTTVTWEYRVANTGTTPLTAISVDDDMGVSVSCAATTLAPGASMTCTGTGVATLGQYRNVGRVTASYTTGTMSGTVTDSDASHYLGISPTVDGAKVTLCHKTGNGSYHAITVALDAEPAHRAHGDARVGEAVPGQPGKVFGATCQVQ